MPVKTLFAFLFVIVSSISFADSTTVMLSKDKFEHISFSRINPSMYRFEDGVLHASVDQSASFLMQAFDMIRPVSSVEFEWQTEGRLKLKDSEQEKTRAGDDAVFKIGLLVKGEKRFDNPLAPKWIKRVQSLLKESSDSMYYLVADSKHPSDATWVNPYNKKVTMVSMHNKQQGEWNHSRYEFDMSVEVVAIWLMADGDTTKSMFLSKVRRLKLN